MGTRKSRHNKGRKPLYKDHRSVAANLLARPWASEAMRGWYGNTRTWWGQVETFKLDILCEADADIEMSADVFGRSPSTLAHKARGLGLTLPTQWARLIAPKRKPKKFVLKESAPRYPYIVVPRDEHADLLAVNAIVPRSIPDHMRADMCQEIMVAILEGRTTLEMLKAKSDSAAYFIKKFYHDNFEQGGHAISIHAAEEDWNSERVLATLAAKDWRDEQMAEHAKYSLRTYTPATQFEAAWRDQVGRAHLSYHQLGQFLSLEEVEELMEAAE